MPDEDAEPQDGGTVATAEAPPEVSDILPKDSPEPVPAAEQEPGDKPKSEASGPEEEGAKKEKVEPSVRDQLKERMEAIKKDDPELFNELVTPEEQERLQTPDASDIEQRELAVAQKERQAEIGKAEQAYAGQKEALRQNVGSTMQALHNDLVRQAQAVADPDQTASEITPDWRDMATAVDQLQRQTEAATWNYVTNHVQNSLQRALATHSSARHLNSQDRQKIRDASPDERLAVMLLTQLDAAEQRGASEAVRAKAKEDAEKTVGMAEHLERVTALMGNGAGNRAEAGGDGGRKRYTTEAAVHAAHAADEITTAQARRLLAGFNKE